MKISVITPTRNSAATIRDTLGSILAQKHPEIEHLYELMLRYIHKHRIAPAYIPAVLVKMRTGGVSNRSWANRLQANADDRKAWTLNGLRPYWFTCSLKPMRKLAQFIR